MMKRLSIRWRLTLWYGGVLAVLLAIFGTAVYLTMRHHQLERIDRGLAEELADVPATVGSSSWKRHAGQRPRGASGGNSRPQAEQVFCIVAIMASLEYRGKTGKV